MRGEFPDDVSEPTAAAETSLGNTSHTVEKPPKKPKNQHWFHGESLKSSVSIVDRCRIRRRNSVHENGKFVFALSILCIMSVMFV